jgi:hypothetical protein
MVIRVANESIVHIEKIVENIDEKVILVAK